MKSTKSTKTAASTLPGTSDLSILADLAGNEFHPG